MSSKKRTMKVLLGMTAITALVLGPLAAGEANASTSVDGKIVNGRILVPLREVAEGSSYGIAWDQNTKTATVSKEERESKVTVGFRTAQQNGYAVELDEAARLIGGEVYVPIRFVKEAFGAVEIVWSPSTRMANIWFSDPEENIYVSVH